MIWESALTINISGLDKATNQIPDNFLQKNAYPVFNLYKL